MVPEVVAEALAGFAALIDRLLALPLDELGPADLASALDAMEVQRRRLDAVDQRAIAAAVECGLAGSVGQPGLADVLAARLRIDVREARARVQRAADLGPRRALTGQPLEPLLPATAAASRSGEVSAAQAQVIIDCLDAIPAEAPAAAWPVAERTLVAAARHEPPRQLRRTAVELLARLDPDGLEPVEDKIERQRGFSLVKRGDGSSVPRGVWTAELTAQWEAILDSLAAPQPAGDQPDDRTAAQRRHDAMAEAATRLLGSATLPDNAGVPVTVLATTTIRELAEAASSGAQPESEGRRPAAAGLALLGHGQLMSVRRLLHLACDAAVVPVVLNDAGGVLAYGRERRLASRGQRLALVARDGGCAFPGCDRPAAWTEVHHVREWAAGGATDLDNMVLLCRFHHRHFAGLGWTVRMRPDGLPEWLPPPWLDPQQRPVRNTTHHRPDFEFRQPGSAA